MKKVKIQIKSIFGDVLFEYEKENNTLKDTLEKAIKSGADLSGANLSGANLSEADLSEANLSGANLSEADLSEADLSEANLRWANLSGANLRWANLSKAGLRCADLSGANLSGADLSGANLRWANLSVEEKIRKGKIMEKKATVYKKCQNKIVELELQKGSIVFSINNNKCRTNRAKVISIDGESAKGITIASDYDSDFIYEVGKTVEIDDFDLMYNVECSTGIHFFWTKEEAEKY